MKKYIISLLGACLIWASDTQGQNLNKIWERTFDGGNSDYSTHVSSIGTEQILIAGHSNSHKNGDFLDSNYGEYDVFLAFLDSNGNTLKQKFFGGTSTERLGSVIKVRSGGYCLLASSSSQVSGMKTMPTYKEPGAMYYSSDLWLLRLDDQLNVLWQKGFGGEHGEGSDAFIETSDGGFLIASVSNSDSSGNKTTKNIKSRHTPNNSNDIWVLKLDSLGNIEWQKSYGGEENDNGPMYILPCPDGNFLIACQTTSRNQSQLGGGSNYITKTTLRKNINHSDAWLFKIDPMGNPVWDSSYYDTVYDVNLGRYIQTDLDQSLLLAHNTADSCVNLVYHLRDGENLAPYFFWRKVNQQGACIQEKLVNIANPGTVQSCIQTRDGGYLFSGHTTDYKFLLHKLDSNFELEWTWVPGIIGYPGLSNAVNRTIEIDKETYLINNMGGTVSTLHDFQLTKFAPWQPSSVSPEQHAQLALYPNPGTGAFKLQFPNSAQRRIQVLNLQGQLLQSFASTDAVVWLQLDAPAGTYLVQVEDDYSSYTAQLIKQ